MAWLEFGAMASGLVLQRLLGGDVPSNKVYEIKTENLGMRQVLLRDEAMVLYAPPNYQADKALSYEIILQRSINESPTTSLSLYRASTRAEAEERFNAFIHRLPVFISVVKEYYNVNGLQKVCDALAENPSWSLAHLVVYFNLIQYVKHPKISETLDYPDHIYNTTPLQLAVKLNNIEMVKILLPHSKTQHLDNNGNSMYHYASNTTKEMINLLISKNTPNPSHCNFDGFTPLHLACLSDNPECVHALLTAGADVNISASSVNRSTKSSAAHHVQQTPNDNTQDIKMGGTPLHWCSSRRTLQALIERGCEMNALNFEGKTALHVMVQRNRLECVVELLSHESEIDLIDKEGNTALHLAIEKKLVPIVQCLVVFGCDINIKNKHGHTPRHIVGKDANGGKEDEILYILHSVGAKRCPESSTNCPLGCNAKGTYNGFPPIAASEASDEGEHREETLPATRRNLLRSNSNTTRNGNNEFSSVTHIVDTSIEQIGQSMMGAFRGIFATKPVKPEETLKKQQTISSTNSLIMNDFPTASNASAPAESSSQEIAEVTERVSLYSANYGSHIGTPVSKKGRLLCLDGGGIRGLVLAQMLLEIENLSQTPITHMFDWVAGTSTGGILALGLGCGKTMRQCIGLYLRMKDQCFFGSKPYPSDRLESILKENLGEKTVMTDIKHPKIMVTAVMADRKPVDLHLFRNYKSASDILGIVTSTNNRRVPPPPPEEQLIWRAARASGAAPFYFRAFERYLDGGLYGNNPTLDAMTEMHEQNLALRNVGRDTEATPLSIVVSLGTGIIPITELKAIDVFRPENLLETARLAHGLSALGNLLVDQATAADGRVVDRARAWCDMIGVPYFRFNPQLAEDISLDETSDQKLIHMMWQTKAFMHANRKDLIEMIDLIK